MMPETNSRILAARFDPHVDLLHAFFQSRDVPFGNPEDIHALAARLATPGSFYEDLSSMLRTVVFREDMNVSRSELLELLCSAAGGPQLDRPRPPLDADIGQLLVFVNVVMLSIKRRTVDAGAELESRQEPALPPLDPPPSPAESPATQRSAAEDPNASPGALNAAVQAGSGNAQPSPEPGAGSADGAAASAQIQFNPDAPTVPTELTRVAQEPNAAGLPGSSEASTLPLPQDPPTAAVRQRALLSKPATLVAFAVLLLLAAVIFGIRRPSRPSSDPQRATMPASLPGTGEAPISSAVTPGAAAASPGPDGSNGEVPSGVGNEPATSSAGKPAAGTPMLGASAPGAGQGTSTATRGPTPAQIASDPVAGPLQTNHEAGSTGAEAIGAAVNSERSSGEEPVRARDAFSVQHSSRKGLFTVSSGVMGANLIAAAAPQYPLLAKVTRVEGQVILQAVISRRGTVVATHVLQGPHLLRSAAESCVRKWRYRPYLVNGRPTDVETIVFVNFQLHR